MINAKRLFGFLATGELPEITAFDETLAEHDKRFHPGGYDPKTMTCEFRERRAAIDPVDADVSGGGIKGIFTGSTASYSRPSLIHIGTGEGSQVYGWGLYGSNVRGVAEGYAKAQGRDLGPRVILNKKEITPADVKSEAVGLAVQQLADSQDVGVDFVVDMLRSNAEGFISPWYNNVHGKEKAKLYTEAADWIERNRSNLEVKGPSKGNVYEQTFFTNRADGDESHLISWYDPLNEEQRKTVRQALEKGAEEGRAFAVDEFDEVIARRGTEATGQDLYRAVRNAVMPYGETECEKNASLFLSKYCDIDGIKYPVDSYGGKVVKDGNKAGWNYVSFRDDNIRVDRKFVDGKEVEVRDACAAKYLAMCEDESLDEHDKKYHPDGYKEGDSCNKREGMAGGDGVDKVEKSGGGGQRNGSSSDRGNGVTAEEDAAYMDAVKRGDMETCAKMVREAAAKAMPDTKVVDEDGFPKVVYRGTPGKDHGSVFQYGKNYYGGNRGFWFSSSKERAEGYSRDDVTGEEGDLKKVFLNACSLIDMRPLKFWTDYKRAFEYLSRNYDRYIKKFRGDQTVHDMYEKNQDELYRGKEDGLVFCDEQSWSFIVKLPSQIKSADPVTYDDDGQPIPLSNRFDFTSDDIRY